MAQRIENETYSLAVINERAAQAQAVWDELKVGLDRNVLKAPFEKFLKEDFRDGKWFSLAWLKRDDEVVPVSPENVLALLGPLVDESDLESLKSVISKERTYWSAIPSATWEFHPPHELAKTKIDDLVIQEITLDTEDDTQSVDVGFRVKFSDSGSPES